MAVSHTDRQILTALDTLEELETSLRDKLSYNEVGSVMEKLDGLVAALEDLVSRRSQSKNSDSSSLDVMKQELAAEEENRSAGQQNADRC